MSDSSRRGFLRDLAAAAARRLPEVPAAEPPAAPLLTDGEMERYSRQLLLPEWSELSQLRLRDASVLVVGAGALGSPVALYLAGRASAGWGSWTPTWSRSPTWPASRCTSPPTWACRRSSRP